jgi:hypothetical protein
MGQLRDAINNLQKTLLKIEEEAKDVDKNLNEYGDRVTDLGKKADQGFDVMYLYLIEKFKKQGSTVEAQAKTQLKATMDPGLAQIVKGIIQWQGDLKSLIGKLNDAHKKAVADLSLALSSADKEAKNLKSAADKKKDKWLKSPEYKAKYETYAKVVASMCDSIQKQVEAVNGMKFFFTNEWVDKNFKISADMTVSDINNRKTMDLNTVLKRYNEDKVKMDGYVRKRRDQYKPIKDQLQVMDQWRQNADKMELVAK